MITKEQIKEIENDKNLYYYMIELLKLKKQKGEIKATIIYKDCKYKRKFFELERIE